MSFLTQQEKMLGPCPRKRLGFSEDFGSAYFGFSFFGLHNPFSGTYQKVYIYGESLFVKNPIYFLTDRPSSGQIALRYQFRRAVKGWQSLTQEQKNVYNMRSKGKNYSGYNLYISEHML